MAQAELAYWPDYAVSPGMLLAEQLEVYEMSQAEFARRCGRSSKLISEIINGVAPVEPETAIEFERVLGMDASIWLNVEAAYRLFQAKREQEGELKKALSWAKAFPLNALVKLGFIPKPLTEADKVGQLLRFFGVGSVDAWRVRYDSIAVSYKHSPSFQSSKEALSLWLRIGEILAESQACENYDRTRFTQALAEIRTLTLSSDETFKPRMQTLCNRAGVAFVLVPSLPKTHLCGAARWLTPRKALIQLSLRHKNNAHFWFAFFHEAGHILLHSKKDVFVDEAKTGNSEQEQEANDFSADFLVPRHEWRAFIAGHPQSEESIRDFAARQAIHPGVIVGMLQHERILDWNKQNHLKARLEC